MHNHIIGFYMPNLSRTFSDAQNTQGKGISNIDTEFSLIEINILEPHRET